MNRKHESDAKKFEEYADVYSRTRRQIDECQSLARMERNRADFWRDTCFVSWSTFVVLLLVMYAEGIIK